MQSLLFRRRWWLAPAFAVGVAVVAGVFVLGSTAHQQKASAAENEDSEPEPHLTVETVRPTQGGIERTTVQPGTLQAFESASLCAEVSGYLKTQTVDIGDRVQAGQLLATIDVPDLAKHLEKARAVLDQARARVGVMKATLERARAEAMAAKAAIPQAEAALSAASAMKRYREKVYRRQYDLYRQGALEERLVDEAEEHRQAAIAAEKAATGALGTARAQEQAALAKIAQANADIAEAQAQVQVAQAEVERSEVQVRFATIRSPYTGIVTRRNFFPGDFIRAATDGERTPLLVVERTDKLRMVVAVPDRDVPFADPGDRCDVEIDALPGDAWRGASQTPVVVSRIQGSEDLDTRTMRVEIDLPNPTGRLRQGMYGRVRIHLENPHMKVLSVPSRCLVGKVESSRGAVYVVRDGRAHRVEVRVGADNGVQAEILSGLKATDQVIRRSGGTLSEGVAVVSAVAPTPRPGSH